jgi:hypothetical protein
MRGDARGGVTEWYAEYALTGEAPTNMRDFVKLHAAEFKQRGPAHSRIVTMPESRAAGAHRDSP